MHLAIERIDRSPANGEEQTKDGSRAKYIPFPNELKKYEAYAWGIIKLTDFNRSYKATIGLRVKEKWLRLLDGPSTKNKLVATQKANFIAVNSCKQNDCDTDHILILFDPSINKCWALLVENGVIAWLGDPDDWMKNLLRELGRLTWPSASSDRK